jgi:hypothetical protein
MLKNFYPYIICLLVLPLTSPLLGFDNNQALMLKTFAADEWSSIYYKQQLGHYADGLDIARIGKAHSEKMGLKSEADRFDKTIRFLEKKHLTVGYSHVLFNEKLEPQEPFTKLLEILGLNQAVKANIFTINTWAQKKLLRQGQRWDLQSQQFENLRFKIIPLLEQLGFIHAVDAHFKNYQGALVIGALLPAVRIRLAYLVKLWQQGARFDHLYFLTGKRPVEPHYENLQAYNNDESSPLKIDKNWAKPSSLPQTEYEMIQLVWQQAEIPETMRRTVKVHFIDAPMVIDEFSGMPLYLNIEETIKTWLQTDPLKGLYLVATNAPHILRHDLLLRSIAPSHYKFDTVGAKAHQKELAILLDELARMIFQIHHPSKPFTLSI